MIQIRLTTSRNIASWMSNLDYEMFVLPCRRALVDFGYRMSAVERMMVFSSFSDSNSWDTIQFGRTYFPHNSN